MSSSEKSPLPRFGNFSDADHQMFVGHPDQFFIKLVDHLKEYEWPERGYYQKRLAAIVALNFGRVNPSRDRQLLVRIAAYCERDSAVRATDQDEQLFKEVSRALFVLGITEAMSGAEIFLPDAFEYDYERAHALHLMEIPLRGNAAASDLISDVIRRRTDSGEPLVITTAAGQERFCRQWVESTADWPLPGVPNERLFFRLFGTTRYPREIDPKEGDFYFLDSLANGQIVSNVKGEAQLQAPRFKYGETILVEGVETTTTSGEFYAPPSLSAISRWLLPSAPLHKNYFPRQTLDAALWQGDPGNREPSLAQVEILQSLGLDPDHFVLHLPTVDEYVRLLSGRRWLDDESEAIHLDGYDTDIPYNQERYGLTAAALARGRCVSIGIIGRAEQAPKLAARWMISRRRVK